MVSFHRDSFIKRLNEDIRAREPTDIIITQIWDGNRQQHGELAYLNKREMLMQLQFWKKNGATFSRACNQIELTTDDGEKCWMFIIQVENDDEMERLTDIPLALMFGGLLVSGLPYICFEKSFVDVIQRAIGRD